MGRSQWLRLEQWLASRVCVCPVSEAPVPAQPTRSDTHRITHNLVSGAVRATPLQLHPPDSCRFRDPVDFVLATGAKHHNISTEIGVQGKLKTDLEMLCTREMEGNTFSKGLWQVPYSAQELAARIDRLGNVFSWASGKDATFGGFPFAPFRSRSLRLHKPADATIGRTDDSIKSADPADLSTRSSERSG